VPKELLLVVVLGALKFTWLKALNASAVNHRRLRSPSLKILRKDMFQLFQAGPMIVPMPTLPTRPARSKRGGVEPLVGPALIARKRHRTAEI